MKRLFVGLWLAFAALTASAQEGRVDRCALNPISCLTAPIAKSCPAGQIWSTAGTGIAHCVNADPICTADQKIARDAMGNPSCVARCSSGEFWDGGSCRPCSSTTTASGSCQAGYNGTAYRSVTSNSCTGSTTYGTWDYAGCAAACTQTASTESGSCRDGFSGTATRSVTTDSCTGATYGAWDYSNCSETCTTTSYNESGTCQSGYMGTAYRNVTYNQCTGSVTYGSWNYSGCEYQPECPEGTVWDGSQCVRNQTPCIIDQRVWVAPDQRGACPGGYAERVEYREYEWCENPGGEPIETWGYTYMYGMRECSSGQIIWE